MQECGTRERTSRVPAIATEHLFHTRPFTEKSRDSLVAIGKSLCFRPSDADSVTRSRLRDLANPAIAFPLHFGHLARRNISFEGAETADAGFSSLQGNFVMAGGQRDPKSALLISDERAHLAVILFHRKSGVRQRRCSGANPGWSRISRADRNYSFNP